MADDKRYMGFWIGHLHEGERNRIQAGQLNPQERDMLAKGEDPWAKFRGPLPPNIPAYIPPESKRPKTETLGGSAETWWGHFYVGHLSQEERNRIKRGEFETEEIAKLAKGESPWDWHKPIPGDVRPPADAPPFEEWRQRVIEHFTPIDERIRKAAADAAKPAEPPPLDPSPKQPWSAAAYKRRVAEREANETPEQKAQRKADDLQKAREELSRQQAALGYLARHLNESLYGTSEHLKAIQGAREYFSKRAAEESANANNILETVRRLVVHVESPEMQRAMENIRRIAGLAATHIPAPSTFSTEPEKVEERRVQRPSPREQDKTLRELVQELSKEVANLMAEVRKQRDMEQQKEAARKGELDSVTPVELGPATSEIRADGHSDKEVADYLHRRITPRNFPPPPSEPSPQPGMLASTLAQHAGWWAQSREFFSHLHLLLRVVAFGSVFGCLSFAWTMVEAGEFAAAYVLLFAAVLFACVAIFGWDGIKQFPGITRTAKAVFLTAIILVAIYFGLVFWAKKENKPWSSLLSAQEAPEPLLNPSPSPYSIPARGTSNLMCHVVVSESYWGLNASNVVGATVTARNHRSNKEYKGITGTDGKVTINVPLDDNPYHGQFYTIKATHPDYHSGVGANTQLFISGLFNQERLVLEAR